MQYLAIFASGGGSNALQIMEYFAGHSSIKIALVVCNKADAGVLLHAQKHKIPSHIITPQCLQNPEKMLGLLGLHHINYIALAGFLKEIPAYLVQAFPEKIVNIHPALLPKYGGKGMYGIYVHQAVVANAETETGITIHLVDEVYDHGKHLLQKTCEVLATDTAADVAKKVLALEHAHFAPVLEKLILNP